MRFLSLEIDGVRNLSGILFEPAPGLNLFTGPNASGKTSLLEGAYLLARAHSFRTPRIWEVIQYQQDYLRVTARLHTSAGSEVRVGLEKGKNGTRIRYNGAQLKTVSEQARNVPLHLVSSDSHILLSGSPRERRRWLDWGVFHVEPSCLGIWHKYHAALQHRNALLRDGSSRAEDFSFWEQALQDQAERLVGLREEHLRSVEQKLSELWERLGFADSLSLRLTPGWDREQGLFEQLRGSRLRDREQGYTRYGPHRAELSFFSGERDAARVFSRGQQKMLLLALASAQALVRAQRGLEPSVLLVDDLPAELDRPACGRALELLAGLGVQVFMTATELELAKGQSWPETAGFHVEQGAVCPRSVGER